MRRKVRFAPGAFCAAHPSAWGASFDVPTEAERAVPFTAVGPAIAVVNVLGPLVQRDGCFELSYEEVSNAVLRAASSPAIKTVVLRICSPGGDFAGAIETAREIRGVAAAAGVRLVAFVDAQCLSAGYALACAATEIVITPSAFVGSVGVWSAIVDQTALDAAQGLNWAIVPSAERKVERNPHVPLTKEAIAHMKEDVDGMSALFFQWVAEARNVSAEEIAALEGAEFFGTRAIGAKLAERTVNSWSEFLALESGASTPMPDSEEKKDAFQEMKEALAKMSVGEDSKAAETAKSYLAALTKCDEKAKAADEGAGEDEKDSEGEKEKAKAEDEKKEDAAKALNLAARVHALETQLASERASVERKGLLASRPDFSVEVRSTLAKAPLAAVREAVAKWPRIAQASAAAATITPAATQGKQDIAGDAPSSAEQDMIDVHMGLKSSSNGIQNKGSALQLGYMTSAQAREFAAKHAAKGNE